MYIKDVENNLISENDVIIDIMIDDSTGGTSTPPFTENPQNKSQNKSQNRPQTRHQNRAQNKPQVLTTSRPEPRQPVKVSIRI